MFFNYLGIGLHSFILGYFCRLVGKVSGTFLLTDFSGFEGKVDDN